MTTWLSRRHYGQQRNMETASRFVETAEERAELRQVAAAKQEAKASAAAAEVCFRKARKKGQWQGSPLCVGGVPVVILVVCVCGGTAAAAGGGGRGAGSSTLLIRHRGCTIGITPGGLGAGPEHLFCPHVLCLVDVTRRRIISCLSRTLDELMMSLIRTA